MSSGALNSAALNTHPLNGESGPRRLEASGGCRAAASSAATATRRVLGVGSSRLALATAADPAMPQVGAGAAVVRGAAAASGTRRINGTGTCSIRLRSGGKARFGALTRAPVLRTATVPAEFRLFIVPPEPPAPMVPERQRILVPRETRGR